VKEEREGGLRGARTSFIDVTVDLLDPAAPAGPSISSFLAFLDACAAHWH